MATRVVTVNDVLDGHVGLDLECFDRIYLNGWVPNLQVSGQVVNFLTHQGGHRVAAANDIEVVRFGKGERKLDVMRPHLDRRAQLRPAAPAHEGLITRLPHSNTYVLTPDGQRVAIFYTKLHNRLLRVQRYSVVPRASRDRFG